MFDLNSILKLDSNKDYTFSSSTGKIREVTFADKFKSVFGFSGKDNISKLVSAVKTEMLKTAGLEQDDSIENDLNAFSGRSKVSGAELMRVLSKFRTAKSKEIAKVSADRAGAELVGKTVTSLIEKYEIRASQKFNLMRIMKHAISDLCKAPPLKTSNDGVRQILDKSSFKSQANEILKSASDLITDMVHKNPDIRFSSDYTNYVIETFFKPDGSLSGASLDDLKSTEQVFIDLALKNCGHAISQHGIEKIKPLAQTLIKACGKSIRLVEIAIEQANKLIMRGDNTLRNEEEITKQIENYKSNLAELKRLDANYPGIYKSGLTVLHTDIPLPKGLFTKMAELVSEQPVNAINKLKPTSSPLSINNAIEQYRSNLDNVINQSGANKVLDGGDELVPVRTFLGIMMISVLDPKVQNNVFSALESENCGKLKGLYSQMEGELIQDINDLPKEHKEMAHNVISECNQYLSILGLGFQNVLGRIPKDVDPAEELDYEEIEVGAIVENITATSKNLLEDRTNQYLNNQVKGDSEGAKILRSQIKNAIGGAAAEPDLAYAKAVTPEIETMLNWTMFSEVKKLANGIKTSFEIDLVRNLSVILPGGKKLTNNFETARDELTAFVSGKEDLSYKDADDLTKSKVNLVMVMLSQETVKAMESGTSYALDPDHSSQAMTLVKDFRNPNNKFEFELERSQQGSITFNLKQQYSFIVMHLNGKHPDIMVNDGSIAHQKLSFGILGQDLEKFAKLDPNKFDDTELQAIMDDHNTRPRLRDIAKKIPQEFRLDTSVRTSLEVDVN